MKENRQSTHEKYPTFIEDQRHFFDELITADWDTYQNADWEAARRYEIDCLFKRVSPSSVIDIGCGCGYQDLLMAEKSTVDKIVGIDYSAKSIEVANRIYPHPKVERLVGDIFQFDQGRFDLAVSFQVIEHLTNPVDFLRACARQVRAGGWVAVATPNRERLQNRFLRFAGREPVLADPQHFKEYTPEELIGIGASAQLKFNGQFSYGMSLLVPRLHWRIIPQRWGTKLGYRFPTLADCYCVVFEA